MIDYSKVMTTYEAVSFGNGRVECLTKEEAIQLVEGWGSGELIKWRIERNISGCQPDYVHRSLSLDVYEFGKWRPVNIFC